MDPSKKTLIFYETRNFLKISSFCLIGSAAVAAAASGIADTLSISLFAAAFAASWFFDAARLRSLLPERFFTCATIFYLFFIPIDYFLLSSDWQRVLLHTIWFTVALKLITRASDKDWPFLYFLGSIQLILAAAQTTETVFRISFAVFVISGITALMLFELRRPLKTADEDATSKESTGKSAFPFPAFFITVTGITTATAVAAIPLFFFFPRLPAASDAPWSSDAVSSHGDFIEDIKTIELGRAGLPPQLDAIVMRVKTDAPEGRLSYDLKWRGISFDYYDGRAWMLYRREQQPVAIQGRFYKLEESAMGTELLRQTFFMEETLTNTVFAAHRALAVSTDTGFLRRDSSDNLFAQNPAQGRINYTVVSDTIRPDIDKISDWTPIPDDIRLTWLQLPDLDPRIVQMAHKITDGYERRYDKVLALETWLHSSYEYRLPLSRIYEVPESDDPLAVFLFDTREGHCEYFATALAVMLRVIGIPARVTSGFLAGEYNPVSGSWTVRRKHSHLWTEAWLPPYGWVEFDATPDDDFPAEPPYARFFSNLADAAGLWWRENVTGYNAARQHSVISGFFTRVNRAEDRVGELISSSANGARIVFNLLPQTATPVKIIALIILFTAVLGTFILKRARRRILGVFRRGKRNSQTVAVDFYTEALVFLKAHGFIPEKSQTPMEFAGSLGGHPAASALLDLTRFYNKARFGCPAASFPRDEARALLHSLKTALKATDRDS